MQCEGLIQKLYQPDKLDNDLYFLKKIKSCMRPGLHVLDLGAGAGLKFQYDLKSMVSPSGEVVGADFDPRVCQNPLIHRGVVLTGSVLPFDDESFDLVFSRYVLEHVGNPAELLHEVYRILRPGGMFVFLTPNKWHYVAIASRCTPHSFHNWYNNFRGRNETDTFPTVYQLNSRSEIRRHFTGVGFIEKEIKMRECCPNYLKSILPLFILGVGFERLVNSSEIFAGIRVNILGQFVKPAGESRQTPRQTLESSSF
jgi:ubiquinone/menaquinone biosynthesis C-methylase UbiE